MPSGESCEPVGSGREKGGFYMFKKDIEAEAEGILQVANLMCVAIRTAPRARGIDNIATAVVAGKDREKLADKMKEIGERMKSETFTRDAENVRKCHAVVLAGTRYKALGLRICGLCAFKDCAELEKNRGVCVFNPGDLGIALGSAVSVASAHHVDNRLMYTAGYAALELKLLGEDIKLALGIPLSATGKNIFFDRK